MKRKAKPQADYTTRRRRRAALDYFICELEDISLAEAAYMDNMPENLQGSDAYDAADYCVCLLDEAIDTLRSVYE